MQRLLAMLGIGTAKPVGARGEDVAVAFLKRAGYTIVDRNVRVPMGEADIVARLGDAETGVFVLVEVKTRIVDPARPRPKAESQVGAFKRRKLNAILNHLVKANGWERRRKRIDIVAVEFSAGVQGGEPVVRHLVNAVGA